MYVSVQYNGEQGNKTTLVIQVKRHTDALDIGEVIYIGTRQ